MVVANNNRRKFAVIKLLLTFSILKTTGFYSNVDHVKVTTYEIILHISLLHALVGYVTKHCKIGGDFGQTFQFAGD